jgi:hypothetical protein
VDNVKLETFGDIVECAKQLINRAGEVDDQIDVIVKNAINYAYTNEIGLKDKRFNTAYIPVVNGLAKLPSDLLSVEEIKPSLKPGDRLLGESAIKTSFKGVLEVLYTVIREPLLKDNEEPDVNKKYFWALVMYGCYAYFKHRKKPNEESSYYISYQQALNLEGDHNISNKITDVYSGFGMNEVF